MANQQFCLRWNNYQTNLTQVFDQLLQSESFVDVTLACEGHSLKAHRMVLSACSPYFQELLSDAPCSHPVIILQGVKWTELKAVVEFMYKGEININQDDLGSLLRVAEYLKIRGLAEVDGDPAETAVLTSPSISPAARAMVTALHDESPVSSVLAAAARKRRRLSGGDIELSSRPASPITPTSAPEMFEHIGMDLQGLPGHIRGGGSAPLPGSPAPFANLSSPHIQGPMPPPQMPTHLPHLPHLPPLSPLLNMHSLSRPHMHDDFEIRPGIAEMIREEERRRRDAPDMAKLLESSHHWMGTSMADGGRPVFPSMFADLAAPGPGPGPGGVTGVLGSAAIISKLPPRTSSSSDYSTSPPSSRSGVKPTSSVGHNNLWRTTSSSRRLVAVTDAEINSCNDSGKIYRNRIRDSERTNVVTSNSTPIPTPPPPLPPAPPPPPPPPPPSYSAGTLSLGRNLIQMRTSTPPRGSFEGSWESLRGAVSGPKSGPSRWTQSDLMAALSMVKSGTPIKPAAERCNIPVMTLWRRTRALGIVSSKVQCGFRYPAARKRTKPDAENALEIKPEPDLQFPVKVEPGGISFLTSGIGSDRDLFLNFSKENNTECKIPRDRSPLRTVYRERSREASPKPHYKKINRLYCSQGSSPKVVNRENSPVNNRIVAVAPPHADEDPRVLAKEVSPQSPPKWNGESRPRTPQQCTNYESPRPILKENSPHILQHADTTSNSRTTTIVAGVESMARAATVGTATSTATAHSAEGPDRFCAWVDIVLEGAATGCHRQDGGGGDVVGGGEAEELDSPEDLSTHPQHPISPPPSTSSSTSSNTLSQPPS